jgi:dTDP-4-dehydrorhamnose 3,5-epimerase-like enzyme
VRFSETKVAGAFLIEPEPVVDERGFFAPSSAGTSSRPTG